MSTTEVAKFDPATYVDKVRDKIKQSLVDIIPDEQWYTFNDIPSPLFAMLPSAIAMLIDARPLQLCQDLP